MEETRETKPVDRTGWGEGPWDGEPDRLEWRAHGFPCLLVRNPMGVWCGYVGVPPGHPAHGKGYDDVDADVHGGLTYASPCRGFICHVPGPGEPADVYWLGFDTAHMGDLMPASNRWRKESAAWDEFARRIDDAETYRTMEWTKAETERLAEQLRAAGEVKP